MSRVSRILIFIFTILFISLPAFAQDSPEEQAQQLADEQAKQLMQEMQEMGFTDEDGELDMEALQKMQEGIASMFEQVNVPSGLYENTDYGYSLMIPDGWSGIYVFGVLTIAKGNIGDMMTQMDMSQPSMMIIAMPPDEIEDDIDIENADLNQIKAAMESANEDGIEITVVEVKETTIEGHKTIYVEMAQKITVPNADGAPYEAFLHSSAYMFEANGLRYNIMFATPEEYWNENKAFFGEQLKSFKLMD